MTEKRYVIQLASGSYYRSDGQSHPTHWLDEEQAKTIVHGKFVENDRKTGLPIYNPRGFDQRAFHNTWQENDKTTGKLVKRESYSLMICGQNCIGAKVVEAPDDLKTTPSWTVPRPKPQSINPGLAVRKALGLSKEDAQKILGDEINVNDVDEGFYSDLAAYATVAEQEGAELILDIKNPDGSIFKRWRVTTEGRLVEVARDY